MRKITIHQQWAYPDLGVYEEKQKERKERVVVHMNGRFRAFMNAEKKANNKTYREQIEEAWFRMYGGKYPKLGIAMGKRDFRI